MYQTDWKARLGLRPDSLKNGTGPRVAPNVWNLGFTSFFTDISSEMVASILPVYFVSYLGFSPFQFGVLDGIYQGAAIALLSLAAGAAADHWRRQKEIAVSGYLFSSVSKLGLLAIGLSWGMGVMMWAVERCR